MESSIRVCAEPTHMSAFDTHYCLPFNLATQPKSNTYSVSGSSADAVQRCKSDIVHGATKEEEEGSRLDS